MIKYVSLEPGQNGLIDRARARAFAHSHADTPGVMCVRATVGRNILRTISDGHGMCVPNRMQHKKYTRPAAHLPPTCAGSSLQAAITLIDRAAGAGAHTGWTMLRSAAIVPAVAE